jgi:hypothetical protein
VQDWSPEPQQQSSAEHANPTMPDQALDLTASVAFSPMPTPMDEFPAGGRSGGGMHMTPHGSAPAPEPPVLSPDVPPTGEQISIEYGGNIGPHVTHSRTKIG